MGWAYSALPSTVAIHFNIHGKADGWSGKEKSFLFLGSLILGINILGLALYRYIRSC
jgi:uncharacterized membrane protein